MSYLLQYSQWKKIFEQAAPSAGVGPADFVVASGATKVPMRDVTLNKNQGYPLVDGAGTQDMHLYELGIAAASAGNFSIAKAGEKVTQDIIEFDGNRITDTGKIVIEWNAENMRKPIKVSGNGALVLARAASYLKQVENKGTKVGVIILELGVASRYASIWSTDALGLSVSNLKAKQNTLASAMSQDAVNENDLVTVQALRLNGKGWGFKGSFDNNGGLGFSYKDPATEKTTAIHPPQKSEQNDAMLPYYRKYKISDLVLSGNRPTPKLKEMSKVLVGMINTDLDNLSTYIPQFLKEKMTGIEDQYINRLAKRTQDIIAASKTDNNENRHAATAAILLTTKDASVGPGQSGSPAQDTKEFGSGKS